MADNNQDAKHTSRKDAKREAKIEAKRRKLAEQRAERLGTAESIIPPPGSEKAPDSAAIRPVTADGANREMKIIFPGQNDQPSEGDETKQAAETPAADSRKSEPPAKPSLPSIRRTDKGKTKRQVSPTFVLRCIAALAGLILIICIALRIAEVNERKTDVFVSDEGYNHAAQFDGCAHLVGIDVSVHQKGEINWKQVKTSGVDYVFVRAGYRAADDGSLHADENFAANVKKARKAGLMVGAYFYSQALTPGEAKEEAEYVLRMVKGYDLTMPIAIDYEIYKDGRLDKKIQAGELYAASLYHDIVLGFTNTVEKAGYESAVYASRDMLTNYMQADLLDDMATIWLARYDSDAGLNADYRFWQFTENGRVGGIEGDVDMNFWYFRPEKIYETRAKHKKNAVSVGDCRISFKRSSYKLKGLRAVPKYDITYEGKGLKEGRDYVSRVVHNTKSGTGYVIVRGIGKFKDWISYPFTIE